MTTVKELLAALTHDNWFTQLAVLSDAYREIGENGKADRCDDLRFRHKRPHRTDFYFWSGYTDDNDTGAKRTEFIPHATMRFIDMLNGIPATTTIQSQLLAYLESPKSLRIPRKVKS